MMGTRILNSAHMCYCAMYAWLVPTWPSLLSDVESILCYLMLRVFSAFSFNPEYQALIAIAVSTLFCAFLWMGMGVAIRNGLYR